jgi:hypothetical protein
VSALRQIGRHDEASTLLDEYLTIHRRETEQLLPSLVQAAIDLGVAVPSRYRLQEFSEMLMVRA